MRIWKKSILIFGALLMLVMTSVSSLAETQTDGTNDVIHHSMSDDAWVYTYTDQKDNIDITSISYQVADNNVTLTMTVDGVIEESELVMYYAYYTSAQATYWMWYVNGSGMVYCANDTNVSLNAVVTASGNTITGVFPLYGTDTTKVDLWGTASQYTTSANDQLAEYWADWCPNVHVGAPTVDQEPDDGGDTTTPSTDSNKGTPGFEMIVLVAAIAVALLLLRRKK